MVVAGSADESTTVVSMLLEVGQSCQLERLNIHHSIVVVLLTNLDMDIDDARVIEEIQGTIVLEKITDDDIERAHLMKTHAREQLYGESAVSLGYDAGFFEKFTYAFSAIHSQKNAS